MFDCSHDYIFNIQLHFFLITPIYPQPFAHSYDQVILCNNVHSYIYIYIYIKGTVRVF